MFIYNTNDGLFTVYLITNLINGKRYIGIHKEEPDEHPRAYMGSGTGIVAAIEKYGVEFFSKIYLARFDTREPMVAMEKELVTEDIINSTEYYNRQTGGGHPIMSEEARTKMSESKKGENNPNYGMRGENHPLYGKKGENHPKAKLANIYCYKTDRLIAEAVVINEWCRGNEYRFTHLSATARADRTIPSSRTNRHHHKGIYARYV